MRRYTIPLLTALTVSMSPLAAPVFAQNSSNSFWWPEQLNLSPLRQHAP